MTQSTTLSTATTSPASLILEPSERLAMVANVLTFENSTTSLRPTHIVALSYEKYNSFEDLGQVSFEHGFLENQLSILERTLSVVHSVTVERSVGGSRWFDMVAKIMHSNIVNIWTDDIRRDAHSADNPQEQLQRAERMGAVIRDWNLPQPVAQGCFAALGMAEERLQFDDARADEVNETFRKHELEQIPALAALSMQLAEDRPTVDDISTHGVTRIWDQTGPDLPHRILWRSDEIAEELRQQRNIDVVNTENLLFRWLGSATTQRTRTTMADAQGAAQSSHNVAYLAAKVLGERVI